MFSLIAVARLFGSRGVRQPCQPRWNFHPKMAGTSSLALNRICAPPRLPLIDETRRTGLQRS